MPPVPKKTAAKPVKKVEATDIKTEPTKIITAAHDLITALDKSIQHGASHTLAVMDGLSRLKHESGYTLPVNAPVEGDKDWFASYTT